MFHGVTVEREREEGERGKKNGRITEENLPPIKFLFPTYKVPFALLKSFDFVLLLSFFCDPEGKKKTPSAFVYSGCSVYLSVYITLTFRKSDRSLSRFEPFILVATII